MVSKARFFYSGIRVRNLERSLKFYRVLGFKVFRRGVMDHGGVWVHLKFPGSHHRLELNFYPAHTPYHERYRTGSEFDHFGIAVPDLTRWVALARRAGGKTRYELPDGRMRLVYVSDPDGIWWEFIGPDHGPVLSGDRQRKGARRSATAQ
jgi:lactoylglutathione lyase